MNRTQQVLLFILGLFIADLLLIWTSPSEEENSDADSETSNQLTSVFMVISKPSNNARRMAIRKSWKPRVDKLKETRLLFFLGNDPNVTNADLIQSEMAEYNDIVLLNITDQYSLLSYKVLNALNWIAENMKNIGLVIKIDDDIWLDVDRFYPVVSNRTHSSREKEPFVWGRFHYASAVLDKGRNADPEYKRLMSVYPPYPNGPLYVLHGKTARYLAAMHQQGWLKTFKNEDANIGIWTLGLKIRLLDDQLFPIGACTEKSHESYAFISEVDQFARYEKWLKECGRPCQGCSN